MTEPTHDQRLEAQGINENIALVQFLVINNKDDFTGFRAASALAVREAYGKRTHDVQVDQVLAGGDMFYQAITVDRFRSGEALLEAYDTLRAERKTVLKEIYALLVLPREKFPRIAKSLGFLAPLLSRWLGTMERD